MDKKFYQSKKFIAFIFSMLILAGILVTALLTQVFAIAMALFMGIGILAIAVMAISYVTNQATLDKFIQSVKNIVPEVNKDGE